MTDEQKNELISGLFEYFKLKMPTNILNIQAINAHLEGKSWDTACEAYVEMTMRKDLKATKPQEVMSAFAEYYRMAKQKTLPKLPEPRVNYAHQPTPTKTIVKAFDENDLRVRANLGRCLQLYRDLIQFDYIKVPAESAKGLFEKIKDDINNMLKIMEDKDFFEVSYMILNKRQKDEEAVRMVLIHYKDIAKQIQGFVNKYSIEAEQQANQPLHELDSQRETEKENLPFQEYNYLNLQS